MAETLAPCSAFVATLDVAVEGARLTEAPARTLHHVALVADPSGLPGPGRAAEEGGLTFLPLGPGQWLAIGDGGALAARLPSAALTDVSDGHVPLLLEGPKARDVLARLSSLDYEAFPPGAVARTLMMQLAATIRRLPDGPAGPAYALEVARSSARSFVHHVEEAMRAVAARG